MSTNENIRILGEIGLDYHVIREEKRYPSQRKVIEFFIKMAEKNHYRLMFHVKGAESDILNLITTSNIPGEYCCIHWYSGSPQILKQLIDLDCYFSCGPALKYSLKHQKVIEMVPISRILTESDGNVKYQGKVGHPGLMPYVIDLISDITKNSSETIQEIILENSFRYLGLKKIH